MITTPMIKDIERGLPRNLAAERAVLGVCLLNEKACKRIAENLRPADFSSDAHRHIFTRTLQLLKLGRAIDLITLTEALESAGQLEGVGGAAYVASLADGVPHISNVDHHVQIIQEKAALRRLAKGGEIITRAALQPDANVESIQGQARDLLTSLPLVRSAGLHAVGVEQLLTMELALRECILDPILPTQSLSMIYSKRGVGKTFLTLGIAHAVSTGRGFLKWNALKPRRVLYVDGELPASTLQERLRLILASDEESRESCLALQLITPDLQDRPMPDLSTREGQAMIENLLEGTEFVILDNLSALCRSGKENEGESWLPIQEWGLRLRQQGVSVLFDHHAGKGGSQRGTSRREDVLDLVISLRHPQNYSMAEGLRCEVHFEKCRALLGEAARPFEVRLETSPSGKPIWTLRNVEDALLARAAELLAEGLTVRDLAEELGISKSQAGRLKRKVEATP